MNLKDYLARIDYTGSLEINPHALIQLQRAHLHKVPFESLDIFLGNCIRLDLQRIYDKVVVRRRGGFCYELNGLFGWLLENLGFEVTLLSGRVMKDGTPGREFAHMLLQVELQDRWIADVGFGDSFIEPLKMDLDLEQRQQTGIYQLSELNGAIILQRQDAGAWEHIYQFSPTIRDYPDFADMCLYQQTSPDSYFARGPICTKLTEDGRITLTDRRLITTRGDKREEQVIGSTEQYRQTIKQCFDINLSENEAARLYETVDS